MTEKEQPANEILTLKMQQSTFTAQPNVAMLLSDDLMAAISNSDQPEIGGWDKAVIWAPAH